MKIRICEVAQDDCGLWVHAQAPAGTFWALWQDGQPEVGSEQHVELEIEEVLRDGDTITPSAVADFSIRGGGRGEPTTMSACVTAAFADEGTIQLQMEDSIVEVEVDGHFAAGSWVECKVCKLKVYAENY